MTKEYQKTDEYKELLKKQGKLVKLVCEKVLTEDSPSHLIVTKVYRKVQGTHQVS